MKENKFDTYTLNAKCVSFEMEKLQGVVPTTDEVVHRQVEGADTHDVEWMEVR